MPTQTSVYKTSVTTTLLIRFCFVLFLLSARSLSAVTCSVVHHDAPSDADKALLAADYDKAVSLYQAELAKHPADTRLADALTTGLVHALLHQQKVNEAAEAVRAALAANPKSAPLITLRGEVEFRQGEPWLVEQTVIDAYKLDPCNPGTRLLFARLSTISSRYGTGRQQILLAHQFDPEDPEIRAAWIGTLPRKERISETEAFLSMPNGFDADRLMRWKKSLERMKQEESQPHKPCRIVSTVTATQIPIIKLMYNQDRVRGLGLSVDVNHVTNHLQIDPSVGGLALYKDAAERAGLKRDPTANLPSATNNQNPKEGYTAYADSIRVGELEFQNCYVHVIDAKSPYDDGEGIIALEVFSHFLVTLDYPMRNIKLDPLPPRPEAQMPDKLALKTDNGDSATGETSQQDLEKTLPTAPDSTQVSSQPTSANPPSTPASPTTRPLCPCDRYIAPEMKDYTTIYRVGHLLLVPTSIDGNKVRLFVLDTATWNDFLSISTANEIIKTENKKTHTLSTPNGKVNIIDEISLNFAHMSQTEHDVSTIDLNKMSQYQGMDIAGYIGGTTLRPLIIHIDYRDGLVKFEYIPDRGYKF